jgi:hypothetical protein
MSTDLEGCASCAPCCWRATAERVGRQPTGMKQDEGPAERALHQGKNAPEGIYGQHGSG